MLRHLAPDAADLDAGKKISRAGAAPAVRTFRKWRRIARHGRHVEKRRSDVRRHPAHAHRRVDIDIMALITARRARLVTGRSRRSG
jgi:hypothetical protein